MREIKQTNQSILVRAEQGLTLASIHRTEPVSEGGGGFQFLNTKIGKNLIIDIKAPKAESLLQRIIQYFYVLNNLP